MAMSDQAPAVVFFGSGKGLDSWQMQQFQSVFRPPHAMFAVPHAVHGAALAIRALGILPQILEEAIDGGSPARLEGMLRKAGLKRI